jgi:hypothetical protein
MHNMNRSVLATATRARVDLSNKMDSTENSRTLWMGGIPNHIAAGSKEALEAGLRAVIARALPTAHISKIQARYKDVEGEGSHHGEGRGKSYCVVTFSRQETADTILFAPPTVKSDPIDQEGKRVQLDIPLVVKVRTHRHTCTQTSIHPSASIDTCGLVDQLGTHRSMVGGLGRYSRAVYTYVCMYALPDRAAKHRTHARTQPVNVKLQHASPLSKEHAKNTAKVLETAVKRYVSYHLRVISIQIDRNPDLAEISLRF